MESFISLICLLVLSFLFALASIVAGAVVSAKAGNKIKNSSYECGMEIFEDAKIQYDIKFFLYAVLFLIFEVETILLFPFAIAFQKLKLLACCEAGIFIILLFLGLIYATKKHFLRWR